jgi:hypothetical protein
LLTSTDRPDARTAPERCDDEDEPILAPRLPGDAGPRRLRDVESTGGDELDISMSGSELTRHACAAAGDDPRAHP